MPHKISACITAGNEENKIRRCLESVRWADEIVVVDSFSTDRTVEISRRYTDRVYEHRWLGYIGQKNLIKDLAAGPWILFIDADEEVSPQLHEEIVRELEQNAKEEIAGYEFPRMVRFLGKWIRHGDWYPDAKMRLFRKDLATCSGREPHDRTTVNGKVKRLRNPIYHYTYDDITDQLASLNHFSTITAQTRFEEGDRFRLVDLIFRPPLRFLRSYVIKRGFMDGLAGLVVAASAAFGVFAKYAKLWELHLKAKEKSED
ncbi:MAG: glycosyltransferase family 2 protein [Kiritimatiellia bacterium]